MLDDVIQVGRIAIGASVAGFSFAFGIAAFMWVLDKRQEKKVNEWIGKAGEYEDGIKNVEDLPAPDDWVDNLLNRVVWDREKNAES